MAGEGALLLDGGRGRFDPAVQRRVWTVAAKLRGRDGVRETVTGMNNLMVVFDPLRVPPTEMEAAVLDLWDRCEPAELVGREIEIPVHYGGAAGEDLAAVAEHSGLSLEDVVRRHSGATYSVAAVGAMPGFPYLSGLDPILAWGRRANPRAKVEKGSVIIGAAQAGIMPCTAPSGWHILGRTPLELFDWRLPQPATLQPGDIIRFTVASVT